MTNTSVTLDDVLAPRRGAARDVVNVDVPTSKMVIFEIGAEAFAVAGTAVGEILPFTKIFYVPGCPDAVEGVINVRGDIESVMRLGALLGSDNQAPGRHTSILLAQSAGMRSGLRVDRILDVVDVPQTAVLPPLSTVREQLKPVAAGTVLHQGRAATVIDVDQLFRRFLGGLE
jgi:purine-binding chemotaxis protein CheW